MDKYIVIADPQEDGTPVFIGPYDSVEDAVNNNADSRYIIVQLTAPETEDETEVED